MIIFILNHFFKYAGRMLFYCHKYSIVAGLITGLVLVASSTPAVAQYRCQTTESADSITTICYHKNQKPSTIESWNAAKTWGWVRGYDASGNRIFKLGLRKVAGHATANVKYYPNGQVSKVVFRSQPDGGIQYYHTEKEFDEHGRQTAFNDYSRPQVLHMPIHIDRLREPLKKEETEPTEHFVRPKETVKCAIPYVSVFYLANETRKTITLTLRPKSNTRACLPVHHNLRVKPRTTLCVDSVVLAEHFLDIHETYMVEIIRQPRRGVRVITAIPEVSGMRKKFTWHLVRK